VALEVYEELTAAEVRPLDLRWPAKPGGRRWDFGDDAQLARRWRALEWSTGWPRIGGE
jgi:hypothetical protein